MTDARRPLHLAVMIGASTAVYAASLAAVTAFQSSDDRALMQRQAPAEDAVTRLRTGHDRLETSIGQAADAYDRAAGSYDALDAAACRYGVVADRPRRTGRDHHRRRAVAAEQDQPAADQPDGGPDLEHDVAAEDEREHRRLRGLTVGSVGRRRVRTGSRAGRWGRRSG